MTRVEHIGTLLSSATLYLADCRDVLSAIPGNSVDMLWTDPPYGHSNHDGDWNARLNEHRGIESRPILNDDRESSRAIVDYALTEAARFLKQDCCCCCCCCGGGPTPDFAWLANRMNERGLTFFHSVIWDKANPGLGQRYRRQHEMVMIAHRAKGNLLWADNERAVSNVFTLASQPRARARAHPNEKPRELVEWFVANHTQPLQRVIDPFMGSGTTGVACANFGRHFTGIEIDPRYFDTACRRIDQAYRQPRLFQDQPPEAKQLSLFETSPPQPLAAPYSPTRAARGVIR